MKLTALLLLVSIFSVEASVYSQKNEVTLNLERVETRKVLETIESLTDLKFFYNNKKIDAERLVSVSVVDRPVSEVLDIVFEGTAIYYILRKRQVILKLSATQKPSSEDSGDRSSSIDDEVVQQSVSGTVTDANDAPLPGANVVEKGTTNGVTADFDGNFSLDVANEDAILEVSYIGFATKEVVVNGQATVNVQLEESAEGLDEVVVVGYGTQKAATVTGSISAVKGEELRTTPSVNFSNTLSGRLPGLVAVTTSGEPGKNGATLRIRGANTLGDNSPLIVVDGIPNRELQGLNPANIESVTVLKDASAAIYGAQAANGVILVTTKRGKIGKLQTEITINQGVSTPTIIPQMADASTYAQMINEINLYRGGEPRYTQEEIQKYKDGSEPFLYPSTDWFETVFKPSSLQNDANVTLTGGTEDLKYFFSTRYVYQDGIYRNSATDYSQFSFRSNIDGRISDNVKIGIDLSGRQENRNYASLPSDQILGYTLDRGKPNIVPFYGEGLPGGDFEGGYNPAVTSTPASGYDRTIDYIFQSRINLDVTFPWAKGLSFTANLAFDKNIQNRKLWQTPWDLYTWDRVSRDGNDDPILTKISTGYSDPRLRQFSEDGHKTTMNAVLKYDFNIAEKHNFNLLVGTETIKGKLNGFQAFRRYFDSDVIDELFAGGDLEKDNFGFAGQSSRLNYFGRVNYDFLSKYLVEFVWRVDGSYIFPSDNRFGFFPGVSLGWRISEEDFWINNLAFINEFKIRGSWGQTGNDRIGEFQYLNTYGFGDPFVFNDNIEVKTLEELRIANENITWEVAKQSNIGFDGQMLKGKFRFSLEYFYNLRENILAFRNASVPATAGLTLPRENIGEVINQGFEIQLGYNKDRGEFKYGVSINGSYAKNEIKFWDEAPGAPIYQQSTGHPMNSNLYYNSLGIFPDQAAIDAYPHWNGARPGDIIFEDVNKDGEIDGLDRIREDRTSLPTFTGGISFSMDYKNFYSSLLLQGAAGAVRYHSTESGEIGNFLVEDAEGRWTVDNPGASQPRTWNAGGAYWKSQENNYWLRSNDYLRLKSIDIGYSFPKNVITELGLQSLKLFISGQNLLTWDKLESFDPETTSARAYPLNKIYNLGLTVNF